MAIIAVSDSWGARWEKCWLSFVLWFLPSALLAAWAKGKLLLAKARRRSFKPGADQPSLPIIGYFSTTSLSRSSACSKCARMKRSEGTLWKDRMCHFQNILAEVFDSYRGLTNFRNLGMSNAIKSRAVWHEPQEDDDDAKSD